MSAHLNKLVLGTVQFGLNYGINNAAGQVLPNETGRILSVCKKNGIKKLDTSAAYGNSEHILGLFVDDSFDIISKYPASGRSVQSVFDESLDNLGLAGIYGYLIHHFDFFKHHLHIWDEISLLKKKRMVEKIGFSIYKTEELDFLLENEIQFDLIQFPYNIFDRSFESYLSKLNEQHVEIHIRSVFLQGLFFKDVDSLPAKLLPLRPYLSDLKNFCMSNRLTVEALTLNYVLHNPNIDGVIIGVDSADQLIKNINSIWDKYPSNMLDFVHSLHIKEKDLLYPTNWN